MLWVGSRRQFRQRLAGRRIATVVGIDDHNGALTRSGDDSDRRPYGRCNVRLGRLDALGPHREPDHAGVVEHHPDLVGMVTSAGRNQRRHSKHGLRPRRNGQVIDEPRWTRCPSRPRMGRLSGRSALSSRGMHADAYRTSTSEVSGQPPVDVADDAETEQRGWFGAP